MEEKIATIEAEIAMMQKRKDYNSANLLLQNARLDEQIAEQVARLNALQAE